MGTIPPSSSRSAPTVGDIGAGSTLGPYELLSPVAQGGMALVWIARQKGRRGFQKLVALKLMHEYLSRDARFEQLFLSEAEIASRVHHSNVCSIRDLGEERGRLYLAMEWVDGETLAAIEEHHRDGLPVPLATRIAADVATGLHAAHELRGEDGSLLGVVHCDVSPQNILVTLDGVVKVADFGLARATSTARHASHGEGFAGGKLSFMAPEQAQGGPIDRRTDVFALGIVLYRLLTGRHPFQGETSRDRLQRMLDPEDRLLPPNMFRYCPRPLSDAVMRALEKDPADRFQTMGAFVRALERAVPEIAKPACREGLAELARQTVGPAVRARREAINEAIRIADERAAQLRPSLLPPPAEDLPSLPSNLLEELPHEPPAALQTSRPVAYTPAFGIQKPARVGAVLGVAAALSIVGTLFIVPSLATGRALSARSTVAAAPGIERAVASRPKPVAPPSDKAGKRGKPKPKLGQALAASAAATTAALPAASAEPAPTESASPPPANDSKPWLLEPGF